VSDHMKTQTTITASDFEHLRDEAERVVHALRDPASVPDASRRTAMQAYGLANCTALLLRTVGEQEGWQTAIADESLDRILQALRVSLEQVDPAREAVA
jgi:hypothetical protein